jgi:ring-1,2-phenylacetyl-CoA epoxidase subunit PaaC
MENKLFKYTLRLADNSLILGQRLGEWCGHGPVLEEDIALTNISLDLIGQATSLLAYAGKVEGASRDEDRLAFFRTDVEFYNLQLVELPNGHFGDTIARQFLFDQFNFLMHDALSRSSDEQLRAIGAKSIKEIAYHRMHSSDWIKRLGDGTEESHDKIQESINALWEFTGDMFKEDELDEWAKNEKIGPDLNALYPIWKHSVSEVLKEATLEIPEDKWMQTGGKKGIHTEHLGFILSEMQILPRTYPEAKW